VSNDPQRPDLNIGALLFLATIPLAMAEKLLITGASGQLGAYLLQAIDSGPLVAAWSGSQTGQRAGHRLVAVDLTHAADLTAAFQAVRPRWIIHLAAMSGVADCEANPPQAWKVNVEVTGRLVELASRVKASLLLASTDLVFDGNLEVAERPTADGLKTGVDKACGYREQDLPAPLSAYGRTKLEAERLVLAYERGVVVRLSLLFGPSRCGRPNFFDRQVQALLHRQPCELFEDEWRTPLSLETAAVAMPALVRGDRPGLFHLGGPDVMSRWEFGSRLAGHLRADPSCLVAARRRAGKMAATRPRNVSLDSSRFRRCFSDVPWPGWEESFARLWPPGTGLLEGMSM
jgi:dTDP-4-dehydrorhamnose reductase